MSHEYDLVVRGGMVIDGSGGEPFAADVGIRGATIVAVGPSLGAGKEEIDAQGKIVTPGFVDVHTHYDGQITWANHMAPSSDHGVTTIVMGNCAIGFAPARAEERELLMQIVSGVEDIPEAVMAEGITWNWETFPQYLDAIEQRHADVDFAAYVAHGPIRLYVMGERGANREPPRHHELGQMTELVREAMSAGALGVSTSHTLSHRTTEGKLAPCETSGEAELLALAEGLHGDHGGVYQLIIDFDDLREGKSTEFELVKRIARHAGRPLTYTLSQSPHFPEIWKTVLRSNEEANAEGLDIVAQTTVRAFGMNFGLDLSFNPFSFHPSYKEIADLPLDQRVEKMRDPELRARILAEEPEHSNAYMIWMTSLYPKTYLLEDIPDYEPAPEKFIGEIALAKGVPAAEVAYDMLLERGGRAILCLPIANYLDGNLDVVRTMMASDATVLALGDGGAHLGLVCDASYPTFALSHWVRDRAQGRFPLPWMIHALTRRPAELIGLNDRGLVAAGYKADLNVIDFERLQLRHPEVHYDLPAKGRRLAQRADGYAATILSGVPTRRDGVPTGELPGRLVRGARVDPAT